MGARGNSGVITSQIFRGMAEALGGKTRFNGLDLANALAAGREDRLRRGREAGRGHDPHGHPRGVRGGGRDRREVERHRDRPDGDGRGGRAIRREDAVAPADPPRSRRRRLRRAGPVPALPGRAPPPSRASPRSRRRSAAGRGAATTGSTLAARIDEGFGYETMFLVQAHPGSRSTSTRSATTSSRSARACSSPATPGRSRSTSTTSGRTRSSATGWGSAA